jgi:hypothetical protein
MRQFIVSNLFLFLDYKFARTWKARGNIFSFLTAVYIKYRKSNIIAHFCTGRNFLRPVFVGLKFPRHFNFLCNSFLNLHIIAWISGSWRISVYTVISLRAERPRFDSQQRMSSPPPIFRKSDEWSSRPKDHCEHNKHKRRTLMPSAGFEPKISAIERQHTWALDGTATGIDF